MTVLSDNIHFSSKSNEWATPRWLFDKLNAEFRFDLDAASTNENALCAKFLTQENDALGQDWTRLGKTGRAWARLDALGQDWTRLGKTIWVNPPYGRLIGKFVKKAFEESLKGAVVVMLIPARTDTKWWHSYCALGEVRFIKGRLKFVNPSVGKTDPAPFPSAIVIFGRNTLTSYVVYKE